MLRSHLTLLAVMTIVVGCKNSTPGPSGSMFDRNQANSAGAVPPSWNSENMVANGGPMAAGQLPNGSVSVDQILAGAHEAAAVGQLEEARAGYEQALQFQPENYVAHHRLAVIADNSQDFRTAEKHYRLALAYAPEQTQLLSELHSDLGYSYLLQGRYAESEQNLKRSLEFNPSYAKALNNLGALYGKQGDYDGALAMFRRSGAPEADIQENLRSLFPNGPPPSSPSYAARSTPAGIPGGPGSTSGAGGLQSQFPPAGSPDAWGRDLDQSSGGVLPSSGEAFGPGPGNAAQYPQDTFGQPALNSFRDTSTQPRFPEAGQSPQGPNGGSALNQLQPGWNNPGSLSGGDGAFGVPGSGKDGTGLPGGPAQPPTAHVDPGTGQAFPALGGTSPSAPANGSHWPHQQDGLPHGTLGDDGPGFGAPGSAQPLHPGAGLGQPETSDQHWPQSQTTVPGQLQQSDTRTGFDHRRAGGHEQSLPSWSPNLPESQSIQQTHFQQAQTASQSGTQRMSPADAQAMLAGMSAGGLFPVASASNRPGGQPQHGASPNGASQQRSSQPGLQAQPSAVQGPGQVQRLAPGSRSLLGSQMPAPQRYWGTTQLSPGSPQQAPGRQPSQGTGTGVSPPSQRQGGVQFGPEGHTQPGQGTPPQWPSDGRSTQHGTSRPLGSPSGNPSPTGGQLMHPAQVQQTAQQFAPRQSPQGQFAQGQLPQGQFPQGQLPENQFARGQQLPSWQDPAADAALREFEDEVRRHNTALNPYSTNRGQPSSISPQSPQSSQHNQWMPENVTVPSTRPRF